MEGEARTWWVLREPDRYGPYTRTELKRMAADGNIGPTDQIWKEGLKAPVLASSISGMEFAAPKPPPAPAGNPAFGDAADDTPFTPGSAAAAAGGAYNPYSSPGADVDLPGDSVNDQGFSDEPRRVPAGNGANWISSGWGLVTAAPGWWAIAFIIWVGINLVTAKAKFAGLILNMLLGPAFAAGLQCLAYTVEQGHKPDFETIFAGFRTNLGSLMLLGILFTLLMVLTVVVSIAVGAFMLLGGGLASLSGHLGDLSQHPEMLRQMIDPESAVSHLLLFLAVFLGLMMAALNAYLYATPLVFFLGMNPVVALGVSFRASFKNFLPLLVYGLLVMLVLGGLAIAAGTMVAGIGHGSMEVMTFAFEGIFASFIPATLYASFRDIFGRD